MMKKYEHRDYLGYWNGVRGAERNPKNYQRRDDGSHIFHNAEEYYEWWYFDAAFDNGYYMVAVFHYRNAFIKPPIPSVQVTVYKPDGTRIDRIGAYKIDQCYGHPDYCNVVMGDNWVKDNGENYELYININNVKAHLTFKNSVPPWKLGTGFNFNQSKSGLVAGWVIPVPGAIVEGEMEIKGESSKLKGTGYHDHNWGNFSMNKIIWGWYWGRVNHEKYTIVYSWVLPKDKSAPVISPLLIADNNEILLSTDLMTAELPEMIRDDQFQQEVPRKMVLNANENGIKFKLDISTIKIIESTKLPKITDSDTYYFRSLADYDLMVEIDGIKDQARGEFLHETMLL
ncbi:MAG: hypothetical protein JRJ39_05060 [Deltaproteobacteria bacterium]|nr:hypothetical protein [Deltaproteobacteria bacterium]MBW1846697.1 hypothetical protein [Deltaproteobacteria bacterium]MBW2363997.1 hypothetical protein [Deltaproteobacteria bacterium]